MFAEMTIKLCMYQYEYKVSKSQDTVSQQKCRTALCYSCGKDHSLDHEYISFHYINADIYSYLPTSASWLWCGDLGLTQTT